MKQEIVMKFKMMFEAQRNKMASTHKVMDASLTLSPEDMMDETDLTSVEMENNMRMRLRNREALFAKKIDEALDRISHGSFGECECCGEDIELRRLEARPTATHCVTCKEESERLESLHIDGHKHKSMGQRLRFA